MNIDQKSDFTGVLQSDGKLLASAMHENRFAKPMMKKTSEGPK